DNETVSKVYDPMLRTLCPTLDPEHILYDSEIIDQVDPECHATYVTELSPSSYTPVLGVSGSHYRRCGWDGIAMLSCDEVAFPPCYCPAVAFSGPTITVETTTNPLGE